MNYASTTDLLLWYGAKELAQIAVPDDLPVVGADLLRLTIEAGDLDAFTDERIAAAQVGLTRMERALSDAQQLMNSYLALRYGLPLADALIANSALPRTCGAIARRLLHQDRVPQEVMTGYEMALSWLKDLATGQAELQQGAANIGAGMAAFDASDRVFDFETLRGFA